MEKSPVNFPGSVDIVQHFGEWPSFHDAEVLSVHLDRSGESYVRIHAFQMTRDVDSSGHYLLTKHAIVTFWLEDVTSLELNGFNRQNVIFDLDICHQDGGFQLELGGCHGIEGSISAVRIRASVEPGLPETSIYRKREQR